jgi:hypothetical protein
MIFYLLLLRLNILPTLRLILKLFNTCLTLKAAWHQQFALISVLAQFLPAIIKLNERVFLGLIKIYLGLT